MTERTNSDWLTLLTARDAVAVADLRETLCRGLRRVLAGRGDASLAEDFAQDAVLRVLDGLGSFRGDSRFLTWALAVATRVAFLELRKARYKDVSLDAITGDGRAAPEPVASPAEAASDEDRESVLVVLRRLIETDLTDRQRVVILGELAGVPQAVLADSLGTNRNALYKLSHDARMNLKRGLVAAGVSAEEVRAAFPGAS